MVTWYVICSDQYFQRVLYLSISEEHLMNIQYDDGYNAHERRDCFSFPYIHNPHLSMYKVNELDCFLVIDGKQKQCLLLHLWRAHKEEIHPKLKMSLCRNTPGFSEQDLPLESPMFSSTLEGQRSTVVERKRELRWFCELVRCLKICLLELKIWE